MFIAYCECQASPPRPVPSTPIGSTTPWLVNPGGMSSVPIYLISVHVCD